MPPAPPHEPPTLLLFVLCLAGASGMLFLFWLNHKIRTRGHPKSEAPTIESRPIDQAPPRPTLAYLLMSRLLGSVGPVGTMGGEQRSDAVEPGTEPSGTEAGNAVPDIVEQLEALDDDALLDILALLRDDEGEYRFAESRVAKFIPGRVEDRLSQVRDIRHTEKPAPPGRVLRVRDNSGERVIPFKVKG